jgi:hypothetical protein
MKEDEKSEHNYWHSKNGEEFIGGIPSVPCTARALRPTGSPTSPSPIATKPPPKPKNLGAKLYIPPTDFEDVGRISVMADPQGATFAIFKAAAQRASAC